MLTPEQLHPNVRSIASHNTSMATMTYEQVFSPPHTPQLSGSPSSQHRPEGSRALKQHLPSTSTATPVPPHTPHASTGPCVQHRPAQSTSPPCPQLNPVTASMKPVVHVPLMSKMPSAHGDAPSAPSSSGTSHASPPHWVPHAQRRLPASHTQWVEGQSLSAVQSHVGAMVHGSDG